MNPARSLALVLFAATGCVWTGTHVSKDLVELSRETRPGGAFVIEVAADGSVVDADTEIEIARVPVAIMEAADKEVPGLAVSAEKEIALGKHYWEVEKKVAGRSIQIMIDDDGKVVGKETELAPDAWPEKIVAAANQAVPTGRITTVELVTGPEALGATEYHVKKDLGNEILRISVLPDGTVSRYVRKIRGEFKPPR
jgi:hypothetical protein